MWRVGVLFAFEYRLSRFGLSQILGAEANAIPTAGLLLPSFRLLLQKSSDFDKSRNFFTYVAEIY